MPRSKKDVIAIVLCGGLGTRLRSVTNDEVPKPMVSVEGRPFLEYLLDSIIDQGITNIVLAVSHRKESIMEHFGSSYKRANISYSIELEPLGTGGAINHAINEISHSVDAPVLVLNGDTFVDFDLATMLDKLPENMLSIAVKEMSNTSRYGRVEITTSNKIISFTEKKEGLQGYINAGVYLINPEYFEELPRKDKYSFEQEFLHPKAKLEKFYAHVVNQRFIDIGIPEDYYRCAELVSG
ncbi:nucleotidyltransferase family protein [Vibrio sp. HN007]|uniref:nucleotidyltransferase family protein n=1 Tax=Vibrio iocasae TaxID=3098914 RepID=UPI0035D42F3F